MPMNNSGYGIRCEDDNVDDDYDDNGVNGKSLSNRLVLFGSMHKCFIYLGLEVLFGCRYTCALIQCIIFIQRFFFISARPSPPLHLFSFCLCFYSNCFACLLASRLLISLTVSFVSRFFLSQNTDTDEHTVQFFSLI